MIFICGLLLWEEYVNVHCLDWVDSVTRGDIEYGKSKHNYYTYWTGTGMVEDLLNYVRFIYAIQCHCNGMSWVMRSLLLWLFLLSLRCAKDIIIFVPKIMWLMMLKRSND